MGFMEDRHVERPRPKRRRVLPLLIFNVIVSAVVMLGVLSFFCQGDDCLISFDQDSADRPVQLVTFEVKITTTPDPNVTEQIRIITATPMPGTPGVVEIPDEVRDATPGAGAPVPTLPPESFNDLGLFQGDYEDLPQGCIPHTIGDGENPSLIAVQYDVSLFTLMAVNRLDEDDAFLLQVGDILIIPLEGCPVEAFIDPNNGSDATEDTTGDETDTTDGTAVPGEETPELTPEVPPTMTLAPTAVNAELEIIDVIGAGDITTEGVVIRNTGSSVVNFGGWMLSDGDGNTFIFPEDRRLFGNAGLTVNTRVGENTPILFFWGRDTAVFGPGDIIVLTDADGNVQASIRLPETP